MSEHHHLYQSEECKVIHSTIENRLSRVEKLAIDHEKRFDTLQTPFWKRLWFLIDGWPWYNLNGIQKPRPWHKKRGDK